jgi:ABC-2 type transport system ATP-binding protein
VIALGTPDELKRRYSADTISVTPDLDPAGLPEMSRILSDAVSAREAAVEHATIRLTVADTREAMLTVMAVLTARGVGLLAASVGRPSLDDVFLRETGRSLRDAGASADVSSAVAGTAQEVAA